LNSVVPLPVGSPSNNSRIPSAAASNISLNNWSSHNMSLFADTLLIVLPVFLIIGLGFGLKRTGLVESHFLFQLNRFIFWVALPALLFDKISNADFTASFNPMLLLGMVLATVTAFILSYAYSSYRAYSPAVRGAFTQGAFRGNLAFFGLAITFNAYGEEGLAAAGILLGFLIPLFNFLAVLTLLLPQRQTKQKLGASFYAYQYAFNPLILSSFVGIIWSVMEFSTPQVLDKTFDILAGMTLPLALISIGASFSFSKMRGEMRLVTLSTAIKLVWLPLLTAGILKILGVGGMDLAIGLIFAGSPTATAAYIMAQQLNSDAELSGAIIMLSTLASIGTFSVMLLILKAYGI
jgi:predicted permease